ncbi:MAG: 4-hydroxyphenylpyruvate dioxygenase [Planctomycetota bacterium]|nr:MAG: 4-hydroxyphenylpyruvate dioxygenase [Planctomycetota bacterium]
MTTATTTPAAAGARAADPLRLIDVDHVRFYVGNAKQAAHYYAHTFGFRIDQFSDLTVGSRDAASYLLTQGNIRFVIQTDLTPTGAIGEEVRRFGDGVKDVAFTVADAQRAFERAVKNGAVPDREPETLSDERGSVTSASIKAYGRVTHTFVSRTGAYDLEQVRAGGRLSPAFHPTGPLRINDYNVQHPCGLQWVDHCVGNVEQGKMNHWVEWYENVLEFKLFKHFDDKDISTEYSALMSKVMDSGFGVIKMPINEPAEGKKKSQIQEYLEWHDMTPGVQHLALRTNDELASVAELRRRDVDFLTLPDSYYEIVWDRVDATLREHGLEPVKEDHQKIRDLGILVDADDQGYLLQLFTKPLQDRPTLFFEIICRRGSQSFGKGNFKALFEALEIEQQRRGNL